MAIENAKMLNVRIKNKYDSYENWAASGLVLEAGEIAIAYTTVDVKVDNGTAKHPALLMKVGDGQKTFANLPWMSARAADVLSVCKDEAALTEFVNTVIAGAGIATDEAMQALTGKVTTAEGKITALEGKMTTAEGKITDAEAAIAALNELVGDTKVETQIANAIAELNLADTYAAKVHKHEIADVNGLSDSIAAAKKAGTDANAALEAYKTLNDAAVKVNSDAIAAIKNGETLDNFKEVEEALAGKQAAGNYSVEGHKHEIADVNGLEAAIADAKKAGTDAAGAAAQALTDAKAYTDTEMTRLVGDTKVADQITTAITDLDLANTYDAKGAAAAAETAAKGHADGLNTAMNARVEALEAIDHDHANKGVLDGITAEKVAAWDAAEGNVQADWNEMDEMSAAYIQNRPFYTISDGYEIVVFDQTISAEQLTYNESKGTYYTDNLDLTNIGAYTQDMNYTVIIDGVTYNLVCKRDYYTYLGDTSLEDVPFCCFSNNGETWFDFKNNGPHSVKIIEVVPDDVITIDDKYISDNFAKKYYVDDSVTAVRIDFGHETDVIYSSLDEHGESISKNTESIDALQGLVGDETVEKQITDAVKEEADRAKGVEGGLETRLAAVEGDYLKAADKEALQSQINTIMNNPDTEGVINSINEFTQYIADHGEIAEGFRTDIDANAQDIANLTATVGNIPKSREIVSETTVEPGTYSTNARITFNEPLVVGEKYRVLFDGQWYDCEAKKITTRFIGVCVGGEGYDDSLVAIEHSGAGHEYDAELRMCTADNTVSHTFSVFSVGTDAETVVEYIDEKVDAIEATVEDIAVNVQNLNNAVNNETSGLLTRMTQAEADIDALEELVGDETVEKQIADAIEALKIGDYAKAADLTAAITQHNTDKAALEAEIAKKANDADLAAIAKTGSTDDLVQGAMTLVFDCGGASV